jgi:hypothetical protein
MPDPKRQSSIRANADTIRRIKVVAAATGRSMPQMLDILAGPALARHEQEVASRLAKAEKPTRTRPLT